MTPEQSYREIPLSQGQVVLVDAIDYEWLNQWKWYAAKCRHGYFYAQRMFGGKCIKMHRLILGLQNTTMPLVDHANRNTLDNRRCNLRPADASQNAFNRKKRTDNKSGYKGIHWDKRIQRWLVVSRFKSIENAIKVRRLAVSIEHREFASTE